MAFPEKLKALRLENGLTQDELGEKLYLSRSSISNYEIGKNEPTEKQAEWLKSLNEQGYAVAVCYGCEEASEKILKYLKLGDTNE